MPGDKDDGDWGIDSVPLKEDQFSYALGARGSARKKLAAASGCIIEYVGRLACFAGRRRDRRRGKDYLRWLLEQRTGQSVVNNPQDRDDCKIIKVPTSSVGFLTGYRGESLRALEFESKTFMFTDGDGKNSGENENLMIFSFSRVIFSFSRAAHELAADIVEDRIRRHKKIGRGGNDGPRGYGGPPMRGGYDGPRLWLGGIRWHWSLSYSTH